jgi:NAD(P)-dependent dehydrogenase (short-subunit alcohol dehydrogenase family)
MITGGSEGLGLALALGFAEEGASVSICARSRDPLETARRSVAALGRPCVAEALDVTDQAAVTRWQRRTAEEIGHPDVLINNASLLGLRVPLREYPLDSWRRTIDVNLTGTLIAMQAVLPGMAANGGGSIINVSSGAAVPPRIRWGAYAVSKAALEGLSINLAAELQETGVRVNLVDPGAMRTAMRADAYPDEDPRLLKEPSALLPLFLWLAGPRSQGVSGQRIVADEWRAQVDGDG